MQVILKERIRKLGNLGDLVNVKDGYARNFLLLKGKAVTATKENLANLEKEKDLIQKEHEKKLKTATDQKEQLQNVNVLYFEKQVSDDGKLYGSITPKNISDLIEKNYSISVRHEDVLIPQKIKDIGVFDFTIDLYEEISVSMKLSVSSSIEQAKALFEASQKSEEKTQ